MTVIKIGSDYKKPDAITVISEKDFKKIVFPLPVSTLLFVGKKTEQALLSMGIHTIGELSETSKEMLSLRFGKLGGMLHLYANGLDDSPVARSNEDAKSVSNGFTFRHDLISREECRVGIDYLSEEIGHRLRMQGQLCSTVSLTIKDEYLRSIQRQKPQNPPSDVGEEISSTAYKILLEEWNEGKPIRMITVSASNLIRKESLSTQISFFEDKTNNKHEKSEKKENAVDKIRQKYGSGSIIRGSVINSDLGIYDKKEISHKV